MEFAGIPTLEMNPRRKIDPMSEEHAEALRKFDPRIPELRDARVRSSEPVATNDNCPEQLLMTWRQATVTALNIAMPFAGSIDDLLVFKASDDELEPTINKGDWLLIDRSQRTVIDGWVYVIWIPGQGLALRRLCHCFPQLRAMATKSLPDTVYDRDAIEIMARVSWVIGHKVN